MVNMAAKIILLAESDNKRFQMFLDLSDGNLENSK